MSTLATRLRDFSAAALTAVRRFPLAFAAAAAGSIAGCLFVNEAGPPPRPNVPQTLLLTAWLGIAPLTAAALVGERLGGLARRVGLSVLVLAGLAACFAGLHARLDEWLVLRFALWLLAGHGLLALAPLVSGGSGFRSFNLMLFARTTSALLFTHVLFAGLCLALLALKQLFDTRIDDLLFPRLWLVLMGAFNTMYVLAGIPRDWDRLDGRVKTPAVLDALAGHVLLPLSVVYLVILYAYSIKIAAAREWPRGWVSAPVIAFAVVGLLTVLLLGPERQAASRLVRGYCRGFFVALGPLLLLLALAVYRRTSEYGLTEERYLLYAIVVFLALVATHFIVAREPKPAVIPAVLIVVAVLASVGPLAARPLAVHSQTARLQHLLQAANRMEGRALVRSDRAVPAQQEAEISDVLGFLEARGALGPLLAWRPAEGARCPSCVGWGTAPAAREVMAALGLTFRPGGVAFGPEQRRRTRIEPDGALRTSGFDWVLPNLTCVPERACMLPGGTVVGAPWAIRLDGRHLRVGFEGDTLGDVPLEALLARAEAAGAQPPLAAEVLTIDGTWPRGRYRLQVSSVDLDQAAGRSPHRVTGTLFVALEGGGAR